MDLDHHDYAKRRRDRLGDSPSPDSASPPPGPAAPRRGRGGQQQQGRQRRDPDGGIYISARSRARKAPLPMKLRALPASFWEQPNLNKGPSPGAIFSALPPLCKDECMEAAARGTPRQAAGAAEATSTCSPKVSHSPANTELLFSLFHSVEPKTAVRRRTRGRPRRAAPASGPAAGVGPRDDDPCLLDSLTGGLLPGSRNLDGLGALEGGRGACVSGSALRGGAADSNNLAQILSDLVVKL